MKARKEASSALPEKEKDNRNNFVNHRHRSLLNAVLTLDLMKY